MKVQVGKAYVDNEGEVWMCLRDDNGFAFPMVCVRTWDVLCRAYTVSGTSLRSWLVRALPLEKITEAQENAHKAGQ